MFYYYIQSIYKQSYQPDIILVNISKTPYLKDSGFLVVPEWLNDKRLTINWVKNIGSYRKLLPALEIAEEKDIVITCDDDVIYHHHWLINLIKTSEKNPNYIISGRARIIRKNVFGNYLNYSKWTQINKTAIHSDLLPIGVDGVLYKKSFLNLNFIYD